MLYNSFQNLRISALGFGTMRLPVHEGDPARINMDHVEEMVDYAIRHGVNYYDTAWSYHDGKAAAALGEALRQYPREQYFLSNKFPGYNKENMQRPAEIFEKQLQDCRVEYFDFYLMHDVDDEVLEDYTDPDRSAVPYFISQKEKGRIRHLGFSTYGKVETIESFLDTFGREIEFCQIPLNYMEWALQNVKDKVEYLKKRGIPIWAMEPLRRGQLAEISEARENVLKMMRPDDTAAGWAFRFAQSVTSVKTVITDMSDIAQLRENIEIFNENYRLLNSKEGAVLMGIASDMIQEMHIR